MCAEKLSFDQLMDEVCQNKNVLSAGNLLVLSFWMTEFCMLNFSVAMKSKCFIWFNPTFR